MGTPALIQNTAGTVKVETTNTEIKGTINSTEHLLMDTTKHQFNTDKFVVETT